MRGKWFVDTKILCYIYSQDERDKAETCIDIIDQLNRSHQIVWSTQVVQEFYVVMTKKYKNDPKMVHAEIERFSSFQLVVNNMPIILSAIGIQQKNQLSFWDSMIVAAATASKCTRILSEDMNEGQIISSVKIVSPFSI